MDAHRYLAGLQLNETDQATSYRTLQLFAHGTWGTYQGTQLGSLRMITARLCTSASETPLQLSLVSGLGAHDQYLPLSVAQQLKLRQLTLVSMAASSKV